MLMFIGSTTANAQQVVYKPLLEKLTILQKRIVPDKRVAILEFEIKDTLKPVVVISGRTNVPEGKQQIVELLNKHKIAFVDSIRLLPEPILGDKLWALAALSVSNLRAKPDDASELLSQTPMGTPLKVLDRTEKWFLVQTPEYYIGWMDAAGLQTLTTTDLDNWKKSNRWLYNRMTGYARKNPDKTSEIVTDLVLDNLFEVISETRTFLNIKLPDGRIGFVEKKACIPFGQWCDQQPDIKALLNIARQMMGSPYLWGGASSKAADCSGFAKLAYYSQGIILARDASQQARYGEAIDFNNMANLQPGDLLFFGKSAERITHVGMYIANGDFIHASGRVHISSIDPHDPKYNPERHLVSARRIISAVNTPGIELAKNHPWYK